MVDQMRLSRPVPASATANAQLKALRFPTPPVLAAAADDQRQDQQRDQRRDVSISPK
jgi:hypothetical protein